MKQMQPKRQLSPFKIAAIYAVAGGLWILFSDRMLALLIEDPHILTRLQTYKGWGFVAVTALLVYGLISRYVSEIKKSEEGLLKGEEYNRNLFKLSPIGLALCRMDGSLVNVNEAFAKIIGRTVEETLTLSYWSITPDKYAEQEQQQLQSLMTIGSYGPYEKEYIHKDGHLVHVRLQGLLIEQDGEQCIWSSVEDITEHKKAEATLRESEERLRLFAEQAPAPIAMLDENLNYVATSNRWLSGHGWNERNLIGRNMYEEFPDIPERWKEIHRRCLSGAVESSEADPWVRADGGTVWVRWEMRPWRKRDGTIGGLVVFSEDITANKKAEEELRITNEELLAINRIITTTTTTTTTTTGVKEILEKVLDEALNITGLEGGTICMITPDETLHLAAHRETSEETIKDLTENIIQVGECLCGECARDHKPLILWNREAVLEFSSREATRGEDIRFHAAYPLVIGERCLGVLCVFTRTDLKPAERRLKLLETVTAQIAIAVDNAQMFQEISHNAIMLEDKVKSRTAELKDSQTALMNMVDDLSRKSEELRVANERLKEMDRLKSMFIASMSHELRTPLNSIIGFSSILLDEWLGALNEEQKLNLSAVLRSGKHLLNLLNDVIDVSKIEAGAIEIHEEDFDVYDVIAEAVNSLSKEIKDKGLELKVEAIHYRMYADRRRLLQCVLNLLSNAMKFTEKGVVRITAQRGKGQVASSKESQNALTLDPRDLTLSVMTRDPDNDFIEISVEDTGIGIRQEDIPKLFAAFVRLESPLKSIVSGTGLGLYLTKKLATEVLKGDIMVESEEEKGSRFVMKIPINTGSKETGSSSKGQGARMK